MKDSFMNALLICAFLFFVSIVAIGAIQQARKKSPLKGILIWVGIVFGTLGIMIWSFLSSLNDSLRGICGRSFRKNGKALLPDLDVQNIKGLESNLSRYQCPVLIDSLKRIAKEEHASIATFSRINLELLSMGAPASLSLRCLKAAQDEVHHAEYFFLVLSKIEGKQYQPRPRKEFASSRSSIIYRWGRTGKMDHLFREAFFDGCWNEGLNAIYFQTLAEYCEEVSLGQGIGRVAEDEMNHQAFAWDVAGWVKKEIPEIAPRYRCITPKLIQREVIWPNLGSFVAPSSRILFHEKLNMRVEGLRNQMLAFLV